MLTIKARRKYVNDVYFDYLKDDTRVQIFFGGASSGKSFFIAQRIVADTVQGRNTLVLRNVARTLRGSCWNEIVKAISKVPYKEWFNISKTEMIITATNNGAQILFTGLDDTEKIKSITPAKGVLTDIWIEEATEIARDDYKQLEKRLRGESKHSKRITLSFNPVFKEHWIYNEFFKHWVDGSKEYKGDGLSILKTTYRDNRFLTEDDIKALEDETDPYYKAVYSEGNWGTLGDVIFRNWRAEDLSDMKRTADKPLFGLDFGFSSDPAAAVKVHYDRAQKKIYILDELHEKGMTNSQLAELLKPWVGGHYITCDSSEPKSIKELQNLGIRAVGAKKGPDSVMHGIQWLQGHELIVDVKCQHTKNELQLYQWRKDREGLSMRVPEDRNNHHIDALRYCLEHESTARYATALNLKGL
ncbi:MAG: PBSX family phage terminase large subunit [Candidatus Sumerlaeales bacterium]|nr:PBSX family phage terminase large subunit [Candidatus Sumerlaeales bacterium]